MNTTPNKPVIYLRYPCYICGESYSKGPSTINHIISAHKHSLPSRRPGYKRPYSSAYIYENDIKMEYDQVHHACCSCWFHSDNYEELQEHVEREHGPNRDTYTMLEKSDLADGLSSGIKKTSKKIHFEDDIDTPYDKTVATTIAQQIVDLGAMLTKILKM